MQRESQSPLVERKEGNVGGSMRVAKAKDEREITVKNKRREEGGLPITSAFAVQQKRAQVQKGSRIEKKKRLKRRRGGASRV